MDWFSNETASTEYDRQNIFHYDRDRKNRTLEFASGGKLLFSSILDDDRRLWCPVSGISFEKTISEFIRFVNTRLSMYPVEEWESF